MKKVIVKYEDFTAIVESDTDVSVASQTLIFKGKILQSVNTLEASGVCDGLNIMLIGRKHSAEQEIQMKEIEKVEKHTDVLENWLLEQEKKVDGIEKGCKSMLKQEALELLKRAPDATYQFQRIYVKLDALETETEHQYVRLHQ
ncbi:PREDICTED: BAG family molecular chaperone regulator 1-like [Priapulus caudatus]|uniref:BAG family molecular chaperone regulator 1-like n=1 Tax=Priapulus caudatus TaxID=37621 RepID=A0ABM1EVM2_PRICU|nr:PREDICTED: BAG family molecular chaperone regulator 1-like [Priapulus caudatus]